MIGIFRVLEVLLPFALFLTVLMIALGAQNRAAKKKTKGRPPRPQTQPRSPRPQIQSRPTPPVMGKAAGPAKGGDHDHIRSTELPHDRKLEQLKTLKDAGLLTQEEYEQRRKKIVGGL